ncbi:hypothetical protein KM868_09740 [Micrococcus luteus]|nr:hypothetical protein [Micrococcus luteus]
MDVLGLTDLSNLIRLVESEIMKTQSDIAEIKKYNAVSHYQQDLKLWEQWLEINESLLLKLQDIQNSH